MGAHSFVETARPHLDSHHLVSFSPEDWESVATAFANAPSVSLGQAWFPQPSERFQPASVRTGCREETLWIYAEIEATDAFNPLTQFNEEFFRHGDVFEVFLRPQGQAAYYEFHVTPENKLFQLRIPSSELFASQSEGDLERWKIPVPLLKSWSRVDPEQGLWRVLIALPIEAIVEVGGSRQEWLFSFSRYDYKRGESEVIHSSTSLHKVLGFHRQHEWGSLQLVSLPGNA